MVTNHYESSLSGGLVTLFDRRSTSPAVVRLVDHLVEWFLAVVVYRNVKLVVMLHPISLTLFFAQGFLLWPSGFAQQLEDFCAGFDPCAYVIFSGLPIDI